MVEEGTVAVELVKGAICYLALYYLCVMSSQLSDQNLKLRISTQSSNGQGDPRIIILKQECERLMHDQTYRAECVEDA